MNAREVIALFQLIKDSAEHGIHGVQSADSKQASRMLDAIEKRVKQARDELGPVGF